MGMTFLKIIIYLTIFGDLSEWWHFFVCNIQCQSLTFAFLGVHTITLKLSQNILFPHSKHPSFKITHNKWPNHNWPLTRRNATALVSALTATSTLNLPSQTHYEPHLHLRIRQLLFQNEHKIVITAYFGFVASSSWVLFNLTGLFLFKCLGNLLHNNPVRSHMLFRHLKIQLQIKTFQHLFNCQSTTATDTLQFESQTCQPKTTDCFIFYTGCPWRNVPDFGRMFHKLKYTDITPEHLYPKLNGYGDNGERSLEVWQLLHTYWLPNAYQNWQEYVISVMLISVLNI